VQRELPGNLLGAVWLVSSFRHPVRLQYGDAEHPLHLIHHFRRQRGGARTDEAQAFRTRRPLLPGAGKKKIVNRGTAEYQVAFVSRTVRQNESALNFVGTATAPPESRVDSVEATSTWTWKSGITQSDTSSGESS
jgi:hypothetical protein